MRSLEGGVSFDLIWMERRRSSFQRNRREKSTETSGGTSNGSWRNPSTREEPVIRRKIMQDSSSTRRCLTPLQKGSRSRLIKHLPLRPSYTTSRVRTGRCRRRSNPSSRETYSGWRDRERGQDVTYVFDWHLRKRGIPMNNTSDWNFW